MKSSEAETTIVVFARAPEPGHAKTRLLPALGPEGAGLLQARLTRRALETAVAAQVGPVELSCAPHAFYPFFEDCARYFPVRLRGQGPGSLGEKMLRACREVLTRSPGVILIGTDCPALSPEHLAAAADVLAGSEAVLTPAQGCRRGSRRASERTRLIDTTAVRWLLCPRSPARALTSAAGARASRSRRTR